MSPPQTSNTWCLSLGLLHPQPQPTGCSVHGSLPGKWHPLQAHTNLTLQALLPCAPLHPDPLGLTLVPDVSAHPHLGAQNILEQLTALSTRQLITCPLPSLSDPTRKLVTLLSGKPTLMGAIILIPAFQACIGIFMTSG